MKSRPKYLWIKVVVPVIALMASAFYMVAAPPKADYKALVFVDELVEDYQSRNCIMVATNRIIEEKEGQAYFGNEVDLESELKYGVAVEFEDSFHFVMFQSLVEMMHLFPGENLVTYIHGDGKSMEKTLWRSSLMVEAYQARLLVFSWPTKVPELNGYKNYLNSQKNAALSKENLVEFFGELNGIEGIEEQHVSALFHSLGNYLLQLATPSLKAARLHPNLFDNLVLNAAAVESKDQINWIGQLTMQEKIYVVSSKNDLNLNGLKYFTGMHNPLGLSPEKDILDGVEYLDVTEAMGFTLDRSGSHSYFVGDGITKSENVYALYKKMFEGKEDQLKEIGILDAESGILVINKSVSG